MTAAPKRTEVGRLAMRVEGDNWNAYYAAQGTMDAAIPLGSIRMAAIANNPERKQAFMDMMRDTVCDLIEEATGVRPEWTEPRRAPEHERAGSA